jgi:hypothetical protein
MEKNYRDDPSFYNSSFGGFSVATRGEIPPVRKSWAQYMQTLFGHPLKMQYSDLDKTAQYMVKVTSISRNPIRLIANDGIMIHDYTRRGDEIGPASYDIPLEATKDGSLTLQWNMETGGGGAGRGCQIAEVWLIKKQSLSVSPNSLKLGSPPSLTSATLSELIGSISITTNSTWSVTTDSGWLAISPSGGSGNGAIRVLASPNTTVTSRSAIVTFSAEGANPVTVTVTQSAPKSK